MHMYEKIDINNYMELLDDKESFNAYCPSCGKEVTFKVSKVYSRKKMMIKLAESSYTPGEITHDNTDSIINQMFTYYNTNYDRINDNNVDKGNLFIKEYKCCLDDKHRKFEVFYWDKQTNKIIKIGEYPSAYDNGNKEYLEKLKKVCSNKEAKDMAQYVNKALIMESNGFGIAALLYMRRAFERLIIISEDKNKSQNSCEKMADRIKNNPLLPEQIKADRRVYNIISEGIHNETEEECMELFNVIKVGFTILLRRTYESVEEKKELEELSRLVSSK